jgi:8-oxo-dGTP diphosphatase
MIKYLTKKKTWRYFMKERVSHLNATVCYLKKDNQVLMIKFAKKWGQVYAPPGGKFETGETPLDCIIREFKEETGLTLINPKLQGISYWHDSYEGIIFVYTATEYEGNLCLSSSEGELEWIKTDDLLTIKQFEQNEKFTPHLFKDELFEGKFLLDDKCKVLKYEIRKM